MTPIASSCEGQRNAAVEHDGGSGASLEREDMDRGPTPIRRVRFGEIEVDLLERELRRQGLRVRLTERTFQVLCLLLESPGQLVRREDFQQRIWPAATNVNFDANLNTALTTLRRALGDSPANPVFIKTVPRQGYRFIAPVTPIEDENLAPLPIVDPRPGATAKRANKSVAGLEMRNSARRLAPLLGLALTVAGAMSWLAHSSWQGHSAEARIAPKVAILVTPFENLSADSGQGYMSDGLTDEIITRLGQGSPERLRVVAPSTAAQYRGVKKSIKQIALEQHVSYILEGTCQRQGRHVHITAQLYKTSDQSSLWAEAYDRDADDLIEVQIDVANRIAQSLSPLLLP